MGLAGAKNKQKLGTDPNNTKWSRNTDTYGHKLLRSQGWQPGQYLGAEGAAHAQWHTEASTTHIRVTLKEDNLGLGAKRNNGDECTGLFDFQHLLGRLNGKTEGELEAELRAQAEMKLNRHVELKLGRIRFVSGGFLVGDKLSEKPASEDPEREDESSASEDVAEAKSAAKPSKKRKADDESEEEENKRARKKEKKEKKEKREKRTRKRNADADADVDMNDEPPVAKIKEKKTKKRKADVGEDDAVAIGTEDSSDEVGNSIPESKMERKERKEREKRDKKEKKKEKRRKESSESAVEDGDDATGKKKKKEKGDSTSASDAKPETATSSLGSGTSTPTGSGSGVSTPLLGPSRNLSRQRFIAQKRMAFADQAALNQIFMIKS